MESSPSARDEQAFRSLIDSFTAASEAESKAWFELFGKFAKTFDDSRSERAKYTPYLNILDVFGLKYAELCHSRVLAWFLNGHAEHEQGPLFLSCLASGLKLAPASFENYEVQREKFGRVDVAVFKRNDFAIFIENKVHHHERDWQVKDLISSLMAFGKDNRIPDIKRYAVFLTDDGRQPTSAGDVVASGLLPTHLLPLKRTDVFGDFLARLEGVPVKSELLTTFLRAYLEAISTHPAANP